MSASAGNTGALVEAPIVETTCPFYYRSFEDLNNLVRTAAEKLPADFDLVVGIPRSGLMVANLVALHLHVPLTDIDGFLAGRVLYSGPRLAANAQRKAYRKVLVVDDSISSGEQLLVIRKTLEGVKADVQYAVAYAQPEALRMVDYAFEVVPQPRAFEWNMMNGPHLARSCVDIDGVLCRDPTDAENDDGEAYLKFLSTVPLRVRPRHRIKHLVTSRLERYRGETEAWLRKNDVPYENLWMAPYRTAAERRAAKAYGTLKAEIYRKTGALLFIESDPRIAREIAEIAKRPVFCYEARKMVYPGQELGAVMTFPGPKPPGLNVPLRWFVRQVGLEAARRIQTRATALLSRVYPRQAES